jgi:hypothetical protein
MPGFGPRPQEKTMANFGNNTTGDGNDGAEPRIIWRNCGAAACPIQLRSILADTKCRPGDDAIINEASGFYVVGPTELVIFLSKSNGVYASLAHYPLTNHHQRARSPLSLSYFTALPRWHRSQRVCIDGLRRLLPRPVASGQMFG